jgi:hypothetical protein
MTDDEVTRFIVLIADFQSMREDGMIWLEIAHAEMMDAFSKLDTMFTELYAEMDEAFWEIAAHYDGGWDILREASDTPSKSE